MKKTITKLMTHKNILLLLLMVILGFSACKKDDDESPYQGAWKGTYTGDEDNGSFSVLISENGKVNGTAVSDSLPNFPFDLEGIVNNNGDFSSSTDLGFYVILFEGKLGSNSGNGTWSADSSRFMGVWEAKKAN